MPLLQNEVICITRASRGVGECISHCLAQEGAKKLILVAEEEQGLKTASGARRGLGWSVPRDCGSPAAAAQQKHHRRSFPAAAAAIGSHLHPHFSFSF